jgi:GNAT superfamily N-acetyltransferase
LSDWRDGRGRDGIRFTAVTSVGSDNSVCHGVAGLPQRLAGEWKKSRPNSLAFMTRGDEQGPDPTVLRIAGGKALHHSVLFPDPEFRSRDEGIAVPRRPRWELSDRRRPLGEARLLHEIGAAGCEVGALRRTLGLHIKRMWVARAARGLGVGRRILMALEEQARRFGPSVVRLETNVALTEAQSLYRSSGYREVAAFNDEPYAHHWFEKIGGREHECE